MKQKLVLLLGIVGVTVSALSFSGTTVKASTADCPLKGTPVCPQVPGCCK